MTETADISHLTLTGVEAALLAGQLLKKGFGTNFQVNAKPGKQNLVTEYDHAAEKLIVETILKRFPGHSIYAEESGSNKVDNAKVCWIVDPMDGTVNFARNIPFFAVSIAICVEETVSA